ncbi:Tudor domain family protein [Brugia pahangi]
MTTSRGFINMPQTIFDKADNTDLDISDEMEEVRELMYELIKTNFSSGVMVEHLAKIYKESYETRGLGPLLPDNWLDHIRVAEEFEVINRGPISMVYTRQRDAPPFIIEPPCNSLNITKGLASPKAKEATRIRLTDRELAQQMKSILSFEPIICPSTVSVIVMKCDEDSDDIYVQLAGTKNNFELLRSAMNSYYEEQSSGDSVIEPEIGGVYAVRESDGHWYRALLKVPEYFTLLDSGRIVHVNGATIRRLRAEYALPRIYPIYAFIITLDKKCDNGPSLCILRTACHTQLPLPLRFISAYIENGLIKYNVQSSIMWIKDRKEYEQNVIRVIPASPQYPVAAGEVELVAMELSEMPKKRFAAHILTVFDADNINIRQCSFDPIPDYITSAVKRDSLAQPSPPPFSELIPGRFYAAKLRPDSNWERIQLLGPSTVDADCFRVYAVDIGLFGIVRKSNMRHLKTPNGLRKILMAKCKIAGIKPKSGGDVWSRESQAMICNVLTSAEHIEVEPVSDWELFGDPDCIMVPFATVKIFADGKSVDQMIVEQGYAQYSDDNLSVCNQYCQKSPMVMS